MVPWWFLSEVVRWGSANIVAHVVLVDIIISSEEKRRRENVPVVVLINESPSHPVPAVDGTISFSK
jgi:hypothetical protein